MNFLVVNGPNLNLLGKREPGIYGAISFEDFLPELQARFAEHRIDYFQSNVEGELINALQEAGFKSDGIVLNAGGYTHTSVAIGDAIRAIESPVIEVHVSNVFARESFRHESFLAPHCIGSITGLGLEGYAAALEFFLRSA